MSNPCVASRRALLAGAVLVAVAGSVQAQPADDPAQLVAIMERYAAALRSNNVEALVALFAPDGVYMRDDLPAVAGTEALRASFRNVFATLKVDLAFEIHETEVTGDMAWLRGTSKGRIKTLSTGVEASESFNQLIVFRRLGGMWKIRAYMYASNRPAPGTTPQ